MFNPIRFKPLCIIGLALSVVACGSDSGSGATQNVSSFGLVIADDEPNVEFGGGDSGLSVIFGRYVEPAALSELVDIFRGAVDTCVITQENDTNRADDFRDGPAFEAISAGSMITFSAADGTIYQATAMPDTPDGIFYTVDPEPLFPLPQGISVDIPGQNFPAIAANIPDITPLTGFLPTSARRTTIITPDTQFTWQPGTDSEARIVIRTDRTESQSIPPVEGNSSPLDFYCDVQDDGFFEFPEQIKTALGANYSNLGEFEAARRTLSIVRQGDSGLLILREYLAD